MLDVLIDVLLDTIKIIPYLFITYLILEFLEHKLTKKNEQVLTKYKRVGPIIGGTLGALPQCGFSTMASNLFSNKIITIGTLVAVFLSTSDEMLPMMISNGTSIKVLLSIILYKVIVAIIIGFIIDLIIKPKKEHNHIHEMCEHDHCDCEHDNILISSLKHTLTITFFILLANLIISSIIFFIGEESISKLLLNKNIFVYLLASLIGLIPNCASSVIITELYLEGLISIGVTLSGLLTGSGIGLLVLFKTNKNIKENMTILLIIYFVGVVLGLLVDLVI